MIRGRGRRVKWRGERGEGGGGRMAYHHQSFSFHILMFSLKDNMVTNLFELDLLKFR